MLSLRSRCRRRFATNTPWFGVLAFGKRVLNVTISSLPSFSRTSGFSRVIFKFATEQFPFPVKVIKFSSTGPRHWLSKIETPMRNFPVAPDHPSIARATNGHTLFHMLKLGYFIMRELSSGLGQ